MDDRPRAHNRADQVPSSTRMTQRPALCCVCGTVRSTTAHARSLGLGDTRDRCLVTRKCDTCGTQTVHAYLLATGSADTDERQPYPALDDELEAELFHLEVDEARSAGVNVSDGSGSGPILASVTQHLDDGVWAVFLDPDASSRRRRLGLQIALRAIREARARTWYVAAPDPEHARPAVRFAVFADSPVELASRAGRAPDGSKIIDPDGSEPPPLDG